MVGRYSYKYFDYRYSDDSGQEKSACVRKWRRSRNRTATLRRNFELRKAIVVRPESQAMRAFFERGNAAALEELQRHYVKPATSAGTAAGKLNAFAPLIGRDWTAPLPNGNLTDTQRFAWMYGKNFIRNPHAVKNAKGEVVYEGETVYAWDARNGRIVWWYWNASGGYLEGTASIGADGTILTEGDNHGGANQLDRTRSTMRITADAWTFAPSYEQDRVWNSEPMRTYR
jgi:hypothetical protein